jgi:hypothetical protein
LINNLLKIATHGLSNKPFFSAGKTVRGVGIGIFTNLFRGRPSSATNELWSVSLLLSLLGGLIVKARASF